MKYLYTCAATLHKEKGLANHVVNKIPFPWISIKTVSTNVQWHAQEAKKNKMRFDVLQAYICAMHRFILRKYFVKINTCCNLMNYGCLI